MAKRVFIGVGHGGSDPGAVSIVNEANANLNISLELKRILESNGFVVGISRTKDENDTLSEEISEANAFKPDLAFEVHNNAGGGDGWECYIQTNGYASKSKAAAQAVEKRVKAIGQQSRGLKTKKNSSGTADYFGWLRLVNAPAILTEGFFVDSKDAYDFDTVAEQKKLAAAYALGVMDYFCVSGSASSDSSGSSTSTSDTSAAVKKNDIVTIASGAVYYDNGFTVPAWVRATKWVVKSVSGDRAVVDASYDGKQKINSPISTKYLTVVGSATDATSSSTGTQKADSAASFLASKKGTYTVVANGGLRLRSKASTASNSTIIELMDNGSKVTCYGYYTGDWLYVVSEKGNVGFAHSDYLKK